MEWQMILAIILVTPVILVPVLFIWYVNVGGIAVAWKEARAKTVSRKLAAKEIDVMQ